MSVIQSVLYCLVYYFIWESLVSFWPFGLRKVKVNCKVKQLGPGGVYFGVKKDRDDRRKSKKTSHKKLT